jgi:hypothetical protein
MIDKILTKQIKHARTQLLRRTSGQGKRRQWTFHMDCQLVFLWQVRGWTAEMCASRLGRSKSSIVGRIWRLRKNGVQIPLRQAPTRGEAYVPVHTKPLHDNEPRALIRRQKRMPPKPLEVRKMPEIQSQRKTILGLGRNECRWPDELLGESKTFCGNSTEKGQVYCPEHLAMSLRENGSRDFEAAMVAKQTLGSVQSGVPVQTVRRSNEGRRRLRADRQRALVAPTLSGTETSK